MTFRLLGGAQTVVALTRDDLRRTTGAPSIFLIRSPFQKQSSVHVRLFFQSSCDQRRRADHRSHRHHSCTSLLLKNSPLLAFFAFLSGKIYDSDQ